jgi:5'-deoxynucleotidase YfbR-like HD superfamily hydrolase
MGRDIYVPDSIDTTDGGEMSFTEVHERFSRSKFGGFLSAQTRYGRYRPAFISRDAWAMAPLGADVNNLKHMPLTASLARAYLKHQKREKALNRSDSQIIMMASETHDWAESITDDVTFDLKTKTENDDEASMLTFLLRRILGGKLSQETLMQIYSTVKDEKSRLGMIFNAIERVGYLRTGLNAWTASTKPAGEVMRGLPSGQEQDLRVNLQWLASNVAANQVGKLLEYAENFHPVDVYMNLARGRIGDLFAGMPATIFDKYPTEGEKGNEQMIQTQKFLTAYKAWKNSKYAKTAGNAEMENPQATEESAS